MKPVLLQQVPRLVVGSGSLMQCRDSLLEAGLQKNFGRLWIVASPSTRRFAEKLVDGLPADRFSISIDDSVRCEPTVQMFDAMLQRARPFAPDVVVGIGGGSPLDVAKLLAALMRSEQTIHEVFGIGLLASRHTGLVCVPTTAGTGSEVSPNAILLDEAAQMKKAVVSPYLVPDAAFIDPELCVGVPAAVTAATGLDALTHCIEAYANNFAHPLVDAFALEGIRKIAQTLATAVRAPQNLAAREGMALGSLYGGLCLGPVNTAAVHALSYPLGSWFHVAHGHANALLLPHVMQFNLPAAPARYAEIARAFGVQASGTDEVVAQAGIERLWQLIRETGLEMRLAALGIAEEEIPRMAAAGLGVQRLMKNNVRAMTQADAEGIYRAAYMGTKS
ncbi:MAG: iron-containing alcohol dehydrogenase [Acidobacteriaceae bacterium]